jgi:undecaprenyl pyrophosphate synthase
MESLEKITFENDRLILSICIDYGGRDEIIRAIEAGARTE